jgi:uncharacterized protein (DUF2237 family)
MSHTKTALAYLHGFASGPASRKACALQERLARRGITMLLPDLNRPSFSGLTLSGAISVVSELWEREVGPAGQLLLIGSSMGGMVAARFAELHPERVARLLLLCPGFDMPTRWQTLLGAEKMARWQREGAIEFNDLSGQPTPVGWGLMADALTHPRFPEVPAPTVIVHGWRDEVVPVAVSRDYAAARPGRVRLVEVDDDHALLASLDLIEQESRRLVDPATDPAAGLGVGAQETATAAPVGASSPSTMPAFALRGVPVATLGLALLGACRGASPIASEPPARASCDAPSVASEPAGESGPISCAIPPDHRSAGGHRSVLGEPLATCGSRSPTGFFRDNYCRTSDEDGGVHVVCAAVTADFLRFTREQGNDLETPRGGFVGLRPGDRWCLCGSRWREAFDAGLAPPVDLAATDESALRFATREQLVSVR